LLERADKATLTKAAVLFAPPRGDASPLKTLLDRGADINAKDSLGNTLLMLAASSDAILVETVKSLLERGAELDTKNSAGKTALDFARLRGATAVCH
jgi:ankyrin repeat protein